MLEQRDDSIPIGEAANGGGLTPSCYVTQTPKTMLEQSCDDRNCDAECEQARCDKLDAAQFSQSYNILNVQLELRRKASIRCAKGFARHAHVILLRQSAERGAPFVAAWSRKTDAHRR